MRPFEIKPLKSIRSVADSLEELRGAGLMRGGGETAHFRIKCMKLPDERLLGFVLLAGPNNEANWYLPLPASRAFIGRTPRGDRLEYPIFELHRATLAADGKVRLRSGEALRGVDLAATVIPYKVSSRDRNIVLHTLAYLGQLGECCPPVYGELVPGPRTMRSDKIVQVRVKNLKLILPHVNDRLPQPISLSVLSKVLRDAGMQMPHSQRERLAA